MLKFIVEGVGEFPLDTSALTLQEVIDLEDETDRLVDDLLASFNGWGKLNGRRGSVGIAAFLWLAMRRANHMVSFKRLVAETDIAKVNLAWDEEPQPDPTDEPPAKPAPASRSARRAAAGSSKK
jgi:hypothetical protein